MTRTSEAIRSDIKRVSAEKCHCVSCCMCNGTGRIRFDDYTGDSEPCEDCDNGVSQVCDRCTLLTDLDHELGEAR